MSESDRVSYSFGMKVSIAKFESADFHLTFSSDVKQGETPAKALARVQEFVEKEAERKLDELRSTTQG